MCIIILPLLDASPSSAYIQRVSLWNPSLRLAGLTVQAARKSLLFGGCCPWHWTYLHLLKSRKEKRIGTPLPVSVTIFSLLTLKLDSIMSCRVLSSNKTPSWNCSYSHRTPWCQLQEEYGALSGETVEIGKPLWGQPLASWLFCRDNTACCRKSCWGCGMPRAGSRTVRGPGPNWRGRSGTWRCAAGLHLLPSNWGSRTLK